MTANSVILQVNQNTQVHPKDDPNIAFHHTFELSLSQKDKQVRIVDDNEVVGKIPLKAFWNSQRCNDQNYYRIHISDMNDSSEEEAWILKNPLLKKTYYERSGKNAVNIIGEIVNEVNDAVGSRTMADTGDSRSIAIKEKEIPELAKNHQVRYAQEMEFKFVKNSSDCTVLTIERANASDPRISIDLPSKACVHTDDGKLKCSDLKGVREIKKSEGSTKHYMTMTRDKDGHYKYYFSDQDGKKIDDLEFRLSDIRITEKALFKRLELDHNLKKLQTTAQTIETHLKNDTDSFEKGTAKTITSHLEKNAVQEKLANSLLQNKEFMQDVKDNAGPSTIEVAKSLLESKGPKLGDAMLHAIENNDANAATVLSRLARDINLQTRVAENLKQDTNFQGRIKGADGRDGPNTREVADLLVNQKAEQLGRAVLNIKGVDQKSKLAVELASNDVLKEGVKDLLKGDSNFKTAVKGETGPQGLRGEPGAKGESPTPESVADELLHPSKDALINRLMFNEIVNPGGDITPKTLADRVKEKLAIDQTFPAEVAAKLFEQPVQLGRAVLSVKDASQKSELAVELARDSTLKTDVKNLLKSDVEKDVGNLPRMARSIQEYEKQSQSSEKQIQKIEKDIRDEEGRIFQLKEEAKAAADESERHAKRSEEAADLSEKHASDAGNHLAGAASSSRSAASFARNAKDASCRVAPEQQGCSSRPRREAAWKESEDQTFQHENSELPYSLTNLDSASFISI